MADNNGGDNNSAFVYMGGNQRVPEDVTHVRVHESVKIIRSKAFRCCYNLVSIEMHDGVEIIEEEAFRLCSSLRRINLTGVRVIGEMAFWNCWELENVEFGDKLESIEGSAFRSTALRTIKLPKIRIIGYGAFSGCEQLAEAEFSKDLEGIGGNAFYDCPRLRRIAIPLKIYLLQNDYVFDDCAALSQVDLVGGIHKTISSLLLDSWRNKMNDEIDRINRILPNTQYEKTEVIQQWMRSVLQRIEHFKSKHYTLLKKFTTLLELALWKVKLDESQDERSIGSDQPAKKSRIDIMAARQEKRITSGANIVITNVLPFLMLTKTNVVIS
jgi:hypothetical protein